MRVGSVKSCYAPTWGSSTVLLRCGAVILCCEGDVECVSISKAALTKVDRHRIACIVVAYQRGRQMQFFAMTN